MDTFIKCWQWLDVLERLHLIKQVSLVAEKVRVLARWKVHVRMSIKFLVILISVGAWQENSGAGGDLCM